MLSAGEVALGIGVAIAVIGAVMLGTASMLRRGRRCPSCGAELQAVPDPAAPADRTWEALACPRCATAVTLASGQRARFAWCPSCRQRALEVPCLRLPDEQGAPVVEVHERCTLCAHEAAVVVGRAEPGRRGLVVPFPDPVRARPSGGPYPPGTASRSPGSRS